MNSLHWQEPGHVHEHRYELVRFENKEDLAALNALIKDGWTPLREEEYYLNDDAGKGPAYQYLLVFLHRLAWNQGCCTTFSQLSTLDQIPTPPYPEAGDV